MDVFDPQTLALGGPVSYKYEGLGYNQHLLVATWIPRGWVLRGFARITLVLGWVRQTLFIWRASACEPLGAKVQR